MEPDYVEDRVFCPNDHPNRPGERTCTYCSAELAPAPEKPVRPHDLHATPERPLRRHLDDRTTPAGGHALNQAAEVDWPIAGCISPTKAE